MNWRKRGFFALKIGLCCNVGYVMAGINVIAAETDARASFLATSFYQVARGIITGQRRPLPPPVESMDGLWTQYEEAAIRQMMAYSFIGGPERLRPQLERFVSATGINELMVVSHIYDPAARRDSYRILAEALRG